MEAVSLSDIFSKMIQYSTYFNKKTLNGFSSFCGKNKLNFMADGSSQKRSKDENGSYTRYWNLYVLKNKYQGKMKVYNSNFLINCVFAVNVINNMLNYAERYQEFLKAQKESGIEIVGYARKSPGEKDEANRTKLLQRMIEKLKSRSLVDKVFVSKISTAGQPFYERDVNQDSFEGSDGSTVGNRQYMLNINLN